jgi:hypothetical protein
MIPASYLFKGYYQRHWLDAEPDGDLTANDPQHRFLDGLTRRIADAMRPRPAGLRRHA